MSILTNVMSFQECSNIFSKGGGEELAKLTGSVFLGEINGNELHAILASIHSVSLLIQDALKVTAKMINITVQLPV